MNKIRLDGVRLDAAWDFGDPVGSEARLRQLRDDLSESSTAVQEVTTQIARALGLQGRFDEALELLDSVVGDDLTVRARVALERGRLCNSSGDPDAATAFFEDAVRLATSGGDDYLTVDGLHMLAIADLERARDWTIAGLKIADASSDPRVRRWVGALQNNLGWSLHDAGDYDAALTAFEAALDAHQQTEMPMQVHIAHWSVARCLRSLGRITEALAIQQRLQRDDEQDSYVDEEINLLQGQIDTSGTE